MADATTVGYRRTPATSIDATCTKFSIATGTAFGSHSSLFGPTVIFLHHRSPALCLTGLVSAAHAHAPFTEESRIMMSEPTDSRVASSDSPSEFDAIIVGAGFSGLYMLHSLRDRLGLSVRGYDAANGVGGTWY